MSASSSEDTDASPAEPSLFQIPNKLYFTIGEVSELSGVETHVLRYWEKKFPTLGRIQRRGKRRYYKREDVLVVCRIRELLYDEGMTIKGAVQALQMPSASSAADSRPRTRKALTEVRKALEDISRSLAN